MSDSLSPETPERVSTIPLWPAFMKPLLEVLSDGSVWDKRPLEEAVLEIAGTTSAEREEVLPSGQYRALNRVGWAMSFLTRAQCIDKPARAKFQITDAGKVLLYENPGGIEEKALKQIAAFQDYVPTGGRAANGSARMSGKDDGDEDPIEQIESGIAKFEADVSIEIIRRLREQHPDFFEQAVVDLLIAMGYGGAEQRVTRLGRTGDGGVDGVIDQDALGLSRVYIQAKRYGVGNAVQRPELQGFVGALADKGATQGVFVTTSTFSSGAIEYVDRIPSRVVLIDGSRLAQLMIRYRVAVQVKRTYDVVEVDEDYFE
ncbi:restriction endonuclease [Lacisediminihabitans sp. H27-G8]|uniref:restriction endonuclease n=1 Tax=Lacisediminihabitans sp. H27-G8 TaxID=3111909 RepID=UPI0038FD1BD3